MLLKDFLDQMEALAPRALALDFDNPGLLIGPEKQDIRKVLVALDCSLATAKEAVDWGADLLLTHHPVFFGGVKHILPDDPATAAPWLLMRHGIGLFAAHTNLDAAAGGVNDRLCEALGISDPKPLEPDGMVRVGTIPPVPLGILPAVYSTPCIPPCASQGRWIRLLLPWPCWVARAVTPFMQPKRRAHRR